MIKLILERAGYETDVAPDGKAAVQAQHENPADIVITDIFMPEMDGFAAIMEMRKDNPETRIIAISGGSNRVVGDYLPIAQQLGAARVFHKPVDRDELLKAVRELDPAHTPHCTSEISCGDVDS